MRMRKKKHGNERIEACSEFLLGGKEEINKLRAEGNMPLRLEIGCGKGDFAVTFSSRYKDKLFVAMEKFSDVAVCTLEKAKVAECDNLKVYIGDAKNLPELFEKGDICELYLNFSDPWPKSGHAKRRLTYREFLKLYKSIMTDDGVIIFKTDNRPLFDFSLEEFEAEGFKLENITYDLHNSPQNEGNIETEYERNFSAKGFSINRVEAYLK